MRYVALGRDVVAVPQTQAVVVAGPIYQGMDHPTIGCDCFIVEVARSTDADRAARIAYGRDRPDRLV